MGSFLLFEFAAQNLSGLGSSQPPPKQTTDNQVTIGTCPIAPQYFLSASLANCEEHVHC